LALSQQEVNAEKKHRKEDTTLYNKQLLTQQGKETVIFFIVFLWMYPNYVYFVEIEVDCFSVDFINRRIKIPSELYYKPDDVSNFEIEMSLSQIFTKYKFIVVNFKI